MTDSPHHVSPPVHFHEGDVMDVEDVHDVPTSDDVIDRTNATIGVQGFDDDVNKSAYTDPSDHTLSTLGNTAIRPWYRRRSYQLVIAVVLVVTIIVAVSVPAARNKKLQQEVNSSAPNPNGSGSSKPFVFVPELPEAEIVSNKQAFNAVLLNYYKGMGLNWNTVMVANSPQAKSLEWVCGSATYLELTDARRVQRYVLGTLYYSTYQQNNDYYYADVNTPQDVPGWTSATNWMSADNECDWEGLDCQDGVSVSNILLREHQLSGTLPLELAFLENLIEMDFTSNFIYVDGEASLTPFTKLASVQSLEMEDNYIVTVTSGFPPSLAGMTSLQKLVMSYNILQGPIDTSLFGRLSQLTHLEAESNFFTGDFPASILSSSTLLYIYMRRNNMQIKLPSLMAPGTLPAIFALWLDSNVVTGGIPSSVGNHTALASFSITNSSLAGTIPTELGSLSGLRRVWLYTNVLSGPIPTELAQCTELEVFEVYQNKLNGTMPPGICQTVQASTYEFKALSADCQQVGCQNCCTQCYR